MLHLYTGSLPMVMNLDFYNSLRPDVRKILNDSVMEVEKDYYGFIDQQYKDQLAFLKAQPGVTVYDLPAAELARWQALAKEANADLATKWGPEWTAWEKVWATLK